MFKKAKIKIIKKLKKLILEEQFLNLQRTTIELNNFQELKKVFGWKENPIIDRPDIYDFEYLEDINERRIRDAESLATVVRNINPKTILEIGTSNGMGTLLISANAPESKIYTINILPEEIQSGEGGKHVTLALEKENIGIAFRQRKIKNITQIYANTAKWEPDIGIIDIVFIDGCHDTEFVYNDTKKILKHLRKGSFIIWHDFNLNLVKKYPWINAVCLAIEMLINEGLLKGRIFNIKDSWVGIYRVE
jgi:predicted O-methyltransferase YrrM